MDLSIDVEYPTGAAFGADFFTGASRGEVRMEGPDGMVIRDEKIVITDRDLMYEGIVCVGERTIRHLAHKFEMVDKWRVDRIVDDNAALRNELVTLSGELATARSQLEFARQMEAQPAERVFLSLDGTKHASERACMEATAKLLGVPTKIVADAVPDRLAADLLTESEGVTA